MDFPALSKLSLLISKSFARDFFRLLVSYQTISASEAASRLDLHIKTAQDFLEGLESLGIVSKQEVFEKKRPYFRYTLIRETIRLEFDLNRLIDTKAREADLDAVAIRERKGAAGIFKTSPKTGALSAVIFYTGKGRAKRERRINLTESQGKFLYYLPFPTEAPLSVRRILEKAGIEASSREEILDIASFLIDRDIIETA